jgi:hypothetical protein
MLSSWTKKFESVPSAGKVMLTLFWDFNGPILKLCQNHVQMISSAQCCAVLEEVLNPTVHIKCRGDGVVLYHDNT